MNALEIFGYIGSVLVAISLMMSNIKQLRWINLFGAAMFSLYGFLIDAIPVFVLNGWIALVDIYYLIRIYRFKDDFDMVKLSSVNTPLFDLLMKRYGDDIRVFFPDASVETMGAATCNLIFRNMVPVGLFVYRNVEDEEGTIEVLVDYVIPESRDFKTAQFLFNRHASELRKRNVSRVISKSKRPGHIDYLKKIGFTQEGDTCSLTLQ
jgi:hypothetical protein